MISTQNTAKNGKKKPRGKPFEPGHPHRFKSKEELGGEIDPRINVGGRPKVISTATAKALASRFPRELLDPDDHAAQVTNKVIDAYAGDKAEITYAEKAALELAWQAANGNQEAVTKAVTLTEAQRSPMASWEQRIIELLQSGKINADIVIAELGDELARGIFIAAGIRGNESGEIAGPSRSITIEQ